MSHHRVNETAFFPTVKVAPGIYQGISNRSMENKTSSEALVPMNQYIDTHGAQFAATSAVTPPTTRKAFTDSKMFIYAVNFDDLTDAEKATTIVTLLDVIPSIKEMGSYLVKQRRFSEPSLSNWNDRIPPAALGLLRWIIASNRSCIVQVDICPGQEDADINNRLIKVKDQVAGIAGWTQCE